MNINKAALDRYLTTPPENPLDTYAENVAAAMDALGSPWDDSWEPTFDRLTERLYDKDYTPQQAGAILHRLAVRWGGANSGV